MKEFHKLEDRHKLESGDGAESYEQQTRIIGNAEQEIEHIAAGATSDEEAITARLQKLGATSEDLSVVLERIRRINKEIEERKEVTYTDMGDWLDSFYQEHFKDIGKSVIAEFRMRPISWKYDVLEKENSRRYKRYSKESVPDTEQSYLEIHGDILNIAESFEKNKDTIERLVSLKELDKDLVIYQKSYEHRRYDLKTKFHSPLNTDIENEDVVLRQMYALKLNQIRNTLRAKSGNDLKKDLALYFQPGVQRNTTLRGQMVFSKKHASEHYSSHIVSVVDRIKAFNDAIEKDKIVLSPDDKRQLREQLASIFEQSRNDLARYAYDMSAVRKFISTLDFSETQKQSINKILFDITLQGTRTPVGDFLAKPAEYDSAQIDKIFIIAKSDIQAYLNVGNKNQVPFSAEQKAELSEAVVAFLSDQIRIKTSQGDFKFISKFMKGKDAYVTAGVLESEQYEKLVEFSEDNFYISAEKYIEQTLANFNIADMSDLIVLLKASPDEKKSNEIISRIPWNDSIYRLLNIHKRPRRAEYDPWLTDLVPLVQKELSTSVLSLENRKDGAILLEFARKVGIKNLPNYFELFKKIQSANSLNDLSQETKDEIMHHFGVNVNELCKNDPSNLNLVIIEVEKSRQAFSKDLANESKDLPDKIMGSKYGAEFFTSLTGTSGHSHGAYLGRVMKVYKETLTKKPELFTVPEGYEQVTWEISEYAETEEADEGKTGEQIQSALSNPDLINFHTKIFNSIEAYKQGASIQERLYAYNKDVAAAFAVEMETIGKKLSVVRDNEKAIENLEKRKMLLTEQEKAFSSFAQRITETSAVKLMESYMELLPDTIPVKQTILMELSLQDLAAKFPDQLNKLTNPSFIEKNPTLDSVSIFHEFVRSHVGEHYLNKKHGESQAIASKDKNLLKYLQKVWGVQDFEKSILAMTEKKLVELERGTLSSSKKAITLIPSKGIQRIVSGDLGGACTSRRDLEFAEGKYPNIVSYSMVLGKDTIKEKFVGSVLFMEAKTENQQPILIVRANNPSQNMANMIDVNELIKKTLEEARSVAKRRGIPYVGVAYNHGTASNRSFVTEYYHKNIPLSGAINLLRSEETQFNGYNIYNKLGSDPTVLI